MGPKNSMYIYNGNAGTLSALALSGRLCTRLPRCSFERLPESGAPRCDATRRYFHEFKGRRKGGGPAQSQRTCSCGIVPDAGLRLSSAPRPLPRHPQQQIGPWTLFPCFETTVVETALPAPCFPGLSASASSSSLNCSWVRMCPYVGSTPMRAPRFHR
jgi:hypothetical protein